MTTTTPSRPGDALSATARAASVQARAARRAARRARAFSMVELAVVLVIVAITSGLAVTRYAGSLGRYRVDMAARRLAADLASAQAAARAAGATRGLTFTPAGVYVIPATVTGTRQVTVDLSKSPSSTSVTKVTVGAAQLSAGTASVRFDGFGQPLAGAVFDLASGTHKRRVTLDASSGSISVTTP